MLHVRALMQRACGIPQRGHQLAAHTCGSCRQRACRTDGRNRRYGCVWQGWSRAHGAWPGGLALVHMCICVCIVCSAWGRACLVCLYTRHILFVPLVAWACARSFGAMPATEARCLYVQKHACAVLRGGRGRVVARCQAPVSTLQVLSVLQRLCGARRALPGARHAPTASLPLPLLWMCTGLLLCVKRLTPKPQNRKRTGRWV